MKIGIYLGYHPCRKDFSLKKEGLGRYLSFLIKGFTKNNNEVVIACPRWLVDAVDELIEEENIPRELVKYLLPSNTPFLYKIYLKYADKEIKIKRTRSPKLDQVAYRLIDKIMDIFIEAKNIFSFGLIFIVAILVAIVLSPFLLIFVVLYFLQKCVKNTVHRLLRNKNDGQEFHKHIFKRMKENYNLRRVADKFRNIINKDKVKDKMRLDSAYEIITKINHLRKPMDIWYCPTAFWEEFNKINGTKVICAPDLVTVEFPTKFSAGDFVKATDEVKKTIEKGKYFITYCDFLKETLLVNKFAKDESNIIAIPHATNNMLEFIDVNPFFDKVKLKEDANQFFVKNAILPTISERAMGIRDYLIYQEANNFSFKDMKYIFYSSQVRPNKNMMTLIKAYEYILREKNVPIKLFLTGDISQDKNLENYIYNKRLQYDILCFHSVSNQQLAALYMQAELVVNPTLYEGGFPFTFGEGMSVGTPSIMSDIPQVNEVVNGYDLKDSIFDPYNYKDLAEKIIYGLNNKEKIYNKQKNLYDQLAKRTWEDVCKDYEEAFKYFVSKEKAEQNEKEVM